ncbi:MAG: hypothetical protein D6730_14130 [Bacteroidetes bacterium]|nr:MAG: hypothetical protein D6730_14130 [Bacteroidota bacterium]
MRNTDTQTVRSEAWEHLPAQAGASSRYRRWFIRQLIPAIGGLRYAWLTFGNNSVEQISESPYIDIAIEESELPEWKDICLKSPYVRASSVAHTRALTTIFLKLEDGSLLEITLIHCSRKKRGIFSNSRVMLDNVHINEEGMKIAPLAFVLEYLFSPPLQQSREPSGLKAYYQYLPLEQKQKILQQLSRRFRSADLQDEAASGTHTSAWRWIKHTGHQMWNSLRLSGN